MEMEYKDEDELLYVCARELEMIEYKFKPTDYDTFKSKLSKINSLVILNLI